MHQRYVRWLLTSTAILGLAIPGVAAALPSGGHVVAGQASIASPNSNQVTITQSSSRAVINWGSFNVSAGQKVQFKQPNASSITLNRVTDGGSSSIDGQLTANGRIWLINPSGIVFGHNAQVNVGGLLATTANIDDSDFIAGNYQFKTPGNPTASIVNEGSITVKQAGLATLVAPSVINQGTITATLGKVQLASGDTFTIDPYGDGLINLAVSPKVAQQLVQNSGKIIANGGQVQLTAAAGEEVLGSLINNTGLIEADSVDGKTGQITMYAAGSNAVAGNVSANKGLIQGDSEVLNSGTLDAAGYGNGQKGGTIQVLGDNVGILTGSKIDASGDAGGGTIRIGGDFHGAGTTPTALHTIVESGTTTLANAVTSGNGGKVTVWADDWTNFAGDIEAKGGARSGNGGYVETSGHITLNAVGDVNASAAHGNAGTWLLDPTAITISTGTQNGITGDPNFTNTLTGAVLNTSSVTNDLNLGTNVTVTTSASFPGDIVVANAISESYSGTVSLTLSASGNIITNAGANIGTTGGPLNIILDSNNTGAGSGYIKIGANLISNGGNITLGGGTLSGGLPSGAAAGGSTNGFQYGINIASGTINAGASGTCPTGGCNITMNGMGGTFTSTNHGIVNSGTIETSGTGNIALTGTGSSTGTIGNEGFNMTTGLITTSGTGIISISGTGGSSSGGSNYGIDINGAGLVTATGTAAINLTGTAGSATLYGIYLHPASFTNLITSAGGTVTLASPTTIGLTNTGITYATGDSFNAVLDSDTSATSGAIILSGSTISTNGGNINLGGGVLSGGLPSGAAVGTSTSTLQYGIELSSSTLNAGTAGTCPTGGCNITLTGTGGSYASGTNHGIYVLGGTSNIETTGTGAINLTGIGGTASVSNYGIDQTGGAISAGSGAINLTGTGGSSGSSDNGIYLSGGTIADSGTNAITLTGTGEGASSTNNYGILMAGGSIAPTGAAPINLTGTAGFGTLFGIDLAPASATTFITSGGGTVTLASPTSINLSNTTITYASGDNFNAVLDSDTGGTMGAIFLASSTISTNGGNINLGGGALSGGLPSGAAVGTSTSTDQYGIEISSSTLNVGASGTCPTGGCNITLDGQGGTFTNGNYGIYMLGGTSAVETTGAGAINLTAQGGATSIGLVLAAGTLTASGNGAINLTGTGGSGNLGIYFQGGTITANSGPTNLTGYGGSSGNTAYGIYMLGGSITSATGAITLTGTAGGTSGANNYGIYWTVGSIAPTGNAPINLTGTAGFGTTYGLYVVPGSFTNLITSAGGAVTLASPTNIELSNTGITYGSGDTFNAVIDSNSGSAGGAIYLSTSTISTNGGNIALGGGALVGGLPSGPAVGTSGLASGITISSSTLNAGTSGTCPTGGCNITLDGTGYATGASTGIYLLGATSNIETTGGGNISLTGTSIYGDFGLLLGGGSITSAGGTISLTGTGGPTASIDDYGIYLGGSTITSGSGAISLTGTGGSTGTYGVGIDVSSGSITSTSGSIGLTGTGGASGAADSGIVISGGSISAGSGAINLTGTGGAASSSDDGIYMTGGTIASSTGAISLNGTGGGASSANNYGILMTGGSIAATGAAAINLTGTAGFGTTYGIDLTPASATTLITSGGGTVTLASSAAINLSNTTITYATGDSFNAVLDADTSGTGGAINLSSSTISTNGGNINLGGGALVGGVPSGPAVGTSGLATGITISSSTLNAGTSGTCPTGGCNITLDGTGYASGGSDGIYMLGGTSAIETTGGGNISLTGISAYDDYGLQLAGGSITTASGTISLTGTGGTVGGGDDGIYLAGTTITSGSGAINLTGTGGSTGGGNSGIGILSGDTITSSSGAISLTGTGGASGEGIYMTGGSISTSGSGTINFSGTGGSVSGSGSGIFMSGGSVTSGSGAITFIGTGGASAGSSWGIYTEGGSITSTSGAISLTGTGGSTSSGDDGIYYDYNGASSCSITSATGPVTLTGTGGGGSGGSSDYGIFIDGGTIALTGNAPISLTGTAGTGTSYGIYSALPSFKNVITSAGGTVTLASPTGIYLGNTGITYASGDSFNAVLDSDTSNTTGNIYLANATISTNGGNIALGGGALSGGLPSGAAVGTSSAATGIYLSSSTLNAGTTGTCPTGGCNITLDGTSNASVTGDGIYSTSTIETTGSGNITLTGISAYNDYGLQLAGGSITSASGTISLTGTGGPTVGSGDYGIYIYLSNAITSGSGAISLVGTGGSTGSANYGIDIGSGSITSTSGSIGLTGTGEGSGATDIVMASNMIDTSGSGSINLTGTGGASGSGISMTGSSITTYGTGGITLTGTSAYNGYGIYMSGGAITAGSGTTTGYGVAGGGGYYGIYLISSATITSGSGAINLTGTGGSTGGGNYGIAISSGDTITSSSGPISLTGTGGASGIGIYMTGGSITTSGSGTINFSGTGGSESGGSGIYMTGGSITSGSGAITFTGTGGANASNSWGIYTEGGSITSTSGSISLTGTGGSTGSGDYGILDDYSGSGSGSITSATGAVTFTGTGEGTTGANNYGIFIDGGTIALTGNAPISLTGTAGTGTSYGIYSALPSFKNVITSAGGTVTLASPTGIYLGNTGITYASGDTFNAVFDANALSFASTSIQTNGGTVTFEPYTANTSVGVDGATGALQVTGAILGDVTASDITVGATGDTNTLTMPTYSWGTAATLITGSGLLSITGTQTMGSHNLTLQSDNLSIGGNLSGTGTLTILPSSVSDTIGVAGGSGTLAIGTAQLNYIQSGWAGITIGSTSDTNLMSLNSYTWNAPLTLFSGTGSIAINGAQTMGGNTFLADTTGGNIALGSSGSISSSASGNAITLAASDGNFTNSNSSSSALSATGGRWLVYSTSPADDTLGNISGDFNRYTCAYGGSCPSFPASGNGLLYSYTPYLTATPNSFAITYGTSANLTGYAYTLSGYLGSDGSHDGVTGSLNGSTNYTLGSPVGNYNINYSTGSLASALGYGFTYANNTGGLTVNPATLTVGGSFTANGKTYDRTTTATIATNSLTLSGIYSGDTGNVSLDAVAAFLDYNAGVGKTVDLTSGSTLAGSAAGNYILSLIGAPTTTATISAKTLYASLTGLVDKTYDRTTTATLASGNYSLSGVIGGDTVLLNDPTSGSYDTRNVGTGKTVSVTGLSISGGDAGNYILSSNAISGDVGEIDAKTLTASLTGLVDKTYDRTTDATLGSGNYSLSGVIGGDNVSLNDPVNGTYDNANVGVGKLVYVSGLALLGSGASNYHLASFNISGAVGEIDSSTPTVIPIPNTVIQAPFYFAQRPLDDASSEQSAGSLLSGQNQSYGNTSDQQLTTFAPLAGDTSPTGLIYVDASLINAFNLTRADLTWANGIVSEAGR